MQSLLSHACKPSAFASAWATEAETRALDLASHAEQSLSLRAPISKVARYLAARLKPGKKQLSAVRFSNGHLEELSDANLAIVDGAATAKPSDKEPEKKPEKTAVAATTVAQPTLGCPAPDFDAADIRATRVLSAFLDPAQLEDFTRRQQFLAVGADSGHRYILTSRHATARLRERTRTLYDLDEHRALCVHDWDVPAAEELLALLIHVSLPGHERYVRSIPDTDGILNGFH